MPALRTRDTQSRSLEVTTDAPQPPTLAIISPTPRAFTFPITHNLSDSPYSSPSNSPFEPDHHSLSSSSFSQCTTPPPFMQRTLSPDSSPRSASPSPSTHKRRKSSCSSEIVERRPKKGDEDYIKRPENAFILFRRKCCEDRQAAQEETSSEGHAKKQRQADLSKTISQQWKGLSPEERQYWEQLAKEKKKEHEERYPNYVYRPQRAKDKGRSGSKKVKGRRGEFDHETDSESVSFVVPLSRHHGRSASAPTPPPYQSIQIPNVYMTPSCPTSPSLLPMISRRSSHPGHPEEAMSNFDFLPSDNHFLSPAFQAGQFGASLQSSEFLRSMFSIPTQRSDSSQLQQLTMPPHEAILLPAHQIVSPASSVGSGSSGPSSPSSGPYTPTSATISQPYSQISESQQCNDALARAEQDLHAEMQMQEDFAAYTWAGNGAMWPSHTDMLLGDDFDLSSIPPIELGMSKYNNDDMGLETAGVLEFGQEFTQALEGSQYSDDGHNLDGILAFDEMMAGHGF